MANIYQPPQQPQPTLADFLRGVAPPVGAGGSMMGRGAQMGQRPSAPAPYSGMDIGGPAWLDNPEQQPPLPDGTSYQDLLRLLQQRYGR